MKLWWPKSYHRFMTQSNNAVTVFMSIAGAVLAISGAIKAFQGEDDAWQIIAFGLGFAGLALTFRWLARQWYGFLNRLANKDD